MSKHFFTMDSKNNKNKLCILQITFKYKSMTPEQTYMYVIFQKILELKKKTKKMIMLV